MRLARVATVTAQGQFTIPKAIRKRLGVAPGDRLAITVDTAAGTMACTPVRGSNAQETAGSLAKYVRRHC